MDLLHSGEFWALAAGLFWAVAVILFKKAGEEVPPLALNLVKGVIALVCLLPVLLVELGGSRPEWTARTWLLLAASGVAGITLADTAFFMALNRLGAGLNAIVDCTYFPLMAGLAAIFLGERPSPASLAGGTLILAGILVGSRTRPSPGLTRRDLLAGLGIGVAGMVLMATSVILVKPLLTPASILPVTMTRLALGTAALLPLVLVRRPDRAAVRALIRPTRRWAVAIPGSVLGAAFAMWAWIAGFTYADITVASMLNQFATIYIFVLATVVLKEPLTRRRVAALLLGFGGAVLVILF